MRVLERNFGLLVFMSALAGCSFGGLKPGLDASTVDGEQIHTPDIALDLTVEVAGIDSGADRVDMADSNPVKIDGAPDLAVSPEDTTSSSPDSPSLSPEVADGRVNDHPVGAPDSADAFVKNDTTVPRDTRPVPDGASPALDGPPDAPMPDAFLGIDCPLGDADQDASLDPDTVLEPDGGGVSPDSAPEINADASVADTAPVEPPVFIASGGGRGPLSTTITTSSTSVDSVPTINNQTVRVMLRTTAPGSQVMVKLTNLYSEQELPFAAAHVAVRSSGGSIVAGSDRTLTFDGFSSMTLGPGTEAWSDPVSLDVARGDTLAISLYVSATLKPTTEAGRGGLVWMTHYLSSPGDYTAAETMPAATSGPTTTHTILFVSEIRVLPPGPAVTLVTLGDSITEGACSTSANGDWPDLLSDRLPALPDGTIVSVFNAGIGSGRFTTSDGAGLRGLSRLDELLRLPKVRWVTILMGVNDISYEHAEASDLISAFELAIANAHAVGVKVIGIPILPFKGSVKDTGTNWDTAQAVNAWIRSPGNGFDGIIDFEPVLDPEHTGAINASLTTSDKVHPNQAGYTAMANSIDLSVFQ